MRCGRRKHVVDVPLLFQLWNDDSLRTEEVALRLNLSTGMLRTVAKRHGLLHRVSVPSGETHDAPSEAEELLSRDSLALSPWVAARAEMFRKQKEQHGEARVDVGVTRFVISGPRRRLVGLT